MKQIMLERRRYQLLLMEFWLSIPEGSMSAFINLSNLNEIDIYLGKLKKMTPRKTVNM